MKKTYVYIAIILAVLAGGLLLVENRSAVRHDGATAYPDDRISACRMDALICPDGSTRGRSGPSCAFDPCPAGESFAGTLTQEGGEYLLEMAPPAGIGAYRMPLQFSRISNVLGALAGRRVIVTGVFTSGNILAVETIEEVENR